MYFKRKVYDKLLEWKKIYSEKYAVLLEGARRVGKSTIAETFAKNEYRSYILIDFSKTTSNILESVTLTLVKFAFVATTSSFAGYLPKTRASIYNPRRTSPSLFLTKYSYFQKPDRQ